MPAPGYLNTGHPATGRPWDEVSLVPAPIHPVQVYQALGSELTYHYAAQHGHIGVMPLFNVAGTLPKWRRFGELLEQYQGRPIRPGEGRILSSIMRRNIPTTGPRAGGLNLKTSRASRKNTLVASHATHALPNGASTGSISDAERVAF